MIGENEVENTYEIKLSGRDYYVIDFKNRYKNNLSSSISTENSERLNDQEIIELISINCESK